MPIARPESSNTRIIAHVDMDCFYVQVEQRKQPTLRGLPSAVVQYNEWKGGGLIAVSYEARKFGVKRSMRGEEAKQVCPEIQLVQVPVARGKADLNIYRNAGSEVVAILSAKGRCERASIDEVYLDLTDAAEKMLAEAPPENLETVDEESLKSHILGLNNEMMENDTRMDRRGIDSKENVREWLCKKDADHRDKLLACGALIVSELRMQVLKETEFTCSAGIAHNKILAKLASGMNKPAQQTVVPSSSVKELLDSLPIKKMKQLGGKLGSSLQSDLGINTVGDLLQFPEEKLRERYGINTGTWLWNIARGISGEEVQERILPKSHGSGKTFPGPRALKTIASVQHWLSELCEELSERLHSDLDQNKRIARTLTLHVRAYKSSDSDSQRNFPSKSCPLRYGASKMQEDAVNLFQAGLREYMGLYKSKAHGSQNHGWSVTGLSVSASKISEIPSGTLSIMKYFHGQNPTPSLARESVGEIQDATRLSPSASEGCSEVSLNEQGMEFSVEGAQIKSHMPCFDKEVNRQDFHKDQNLFTSPTNHLRDTGTEDQDTSLPLTGIECSAGTSQSPHRSAFCHEDHSHHNTVSTMNRTEQKRKVSEEKGTTSILRFFKRTDHSCSSKDENGDDGLGMLFGGSSTSNGTNVGSSSSERREEWSYKAEEIDSSVINELPPEIQDELQAWLHLNKRSNAAKKRSGIDHYFLPTRKT